MLKENILIVADFDGAAGLKTEEEIEGKVGLRAIQTDVKTILRAIQSRVGQIYVWDFESDENNFKPTAFGSKVKVLSHPTVKDLVKYKINKVFLVGFHAKAGNYRELAPHTYSGADVKRFMINGLPVGEPTLFTLFFGQLNIPVVFISGSYFASKELINLRSFPEIIITRKNKKVYPVDVVRKEMARKALAALNSKVAPVKFKKYQLKIVFFEDFSKYYKNTHFRWVGKNTAVASSSNFVVLYQDFANGLFRSWKQKFVL